MWDINCDMGEGCGNDHLLMPFITSANIACGYHAGNDDTIRATIKLCIKHQVHVGAHPSFPDRENFGRKEMDLDAGALVSLVQEQILAVKHQAIALGASLHHVKLHGALYNMASREANLAALMVDAIKRTDESLVVYALCGSKLEAAARRAGLKTLAEAFADRTYTDDGLLTPRNEAHALIGSAEAAVAHVRKMVMEASVVSTTGKAIPIRAETICIHGDGQQAIAIAKAIHLLRQQHLDQNQSCTNL